MFLQIVADEYWRGYLSRNDSIIVELFTGQFKSKTKCPQCHRVRVPLVREQTLVVFHPLQESVTFDPFTSISVPLPKRTAVDTIVTYRNDDKPSTKFRIVMSSDGSIAEFKQLLAAKCGLPTKKVRLTLRRSNRRIDSLSPR